MPGGATGAAVGVAVDRPVGVAAWSTAGAGAGDESSRADVPVVGAGPVGTWTAADGVDIDATWTEADGVETWTEADGVDVDETWTEADGAETWTEADGAETWTEADGVDVDETWTEADGVETWAETATVGTAPR